MGILIGLKAVVIIMIASVLLPTATLPFDYDFDDITVTISEELVEEDCELAEQTIDFSETIECYELAELLASGESFYLIDVRDLEEWNTGYIEGAILIPFREILDDLSKLPADKSTPIVLYCRVGSRSANAVQSLKSIGYTNVTNLIQGTMGWVFEGYPLVIPNQ